MSNEVSKKANHQKIISEKRFVEFYLDNIDNAIKRADDFCQDEESLLNSLGSNIPILFEILREDIWHIKKFDISWILTIILNMAFFFDAVAVTV